MDMREKIKAVISERLSFYGIPQTGAVERDIAAAVLAALREPTEEMVEGVERADLDIYWNYRADGRAGRPEDVWQAMIDSAHVGFPEEIKGPRNATYDYNRFLSFMDTLYRYGKGEGVR